MHDVQHCCALDDACCADNTNCSQSRSPSIDWINSHTLLPHGKSTDEFDAKNCTATVLIVCLIMLLVFIRSVDLFETRLDTFWRCQDVVFDWKADLT